MVKILDFGLARFQHGEADAVTLTRDDQTIGTVDYMAPEQVLDPRRVDVRADLYSLGCTFYFLLTGRILFEGTTVLEKMGKHRWDEAPAMEKFRPDVPVSVMAVVRKLMAKQPAHCYQTPQELIAALPASESTARQLLSTPARPPEVLSAFILSSLKADAERKLGPVAQVVITVPAYFEPIPGKTPRRRATWHKRWSRPSERSPSETGRRCTCTTQGCGKK